MKAGRHPARRAIVALGTALVLGTAGLTAAIRGRWLREPYPPIGREIAWLVGEPEAAYHFETVVVGRVYRSAEPDARFLRYLRSSYAIERIVALNGPVAAHAAARDLGIAVSTFHWSASRPPPEAELAAAVGAMDAGVPVLVHCAGGEDRTGLAVAAYRVRRLGWSPEEAADWRPQGWDRDRFARAVGGAGAAP